MDTPDQLLATSLTLVEQQPPTIFPDSALLVLMSSLEQQQQQEQSKQQQLQLTEQSHLGAQSPSANSPTSTAPPQPSFQQILHQVQLLQAFQGILQMHQQQQEENAELAQQCEEAATGMSGEEREEAEEGGEENKSECIQEWEEDDAGDKTTPNRIVLNTAAYVSPAAAAAAAKEANEKNLIIQHIAKQFELWDAIIKAGGPESVEFLQLQQQQQLHPHLFQSPCSVSSASTAAMKSATPQQFSFSKSASADGKNPNNEVKQNLSNLFDFVSISNNAYEGLKQQQQSQALNNSLKMRSNSSTNFTGSASAFVPRVILQPKHKLLSHQKYSSFTGGDYGSQALIDFLVPFSTNYSLLQQQQFSSSSMKIRGLLNTIDPHTITLQALLAHHNNGQLEMSDLLRIQEEKRLERAFKIERYKNKRRNWIRKISYDCRKRVADSRLRVKGRFISKKDSEKLKSSNNGEDGSSSQNVNEIDERVIQSTDAKKHHSSKQQNNATSSKSASKSQGHSTSTLLLQPETLSLIKKRIEKKQPVFSLMKIAQRQNSGRGLTMGRLSSTISLSAAINESEAKAAIEEFIIKCEADATLKEEEVEEDDYDSFLAEATIEEEE